MNASATPIHLDSYAKGIQFAMTKLFPAELARRFKEGYSQGYDAGYADGLTDMEHYLAQTDDNQEESYVLTDAGRAAQDEGLDQDDQEDAEGDNEIPC
jgi:flagellar biosynthesis/type III secretory pathway protein FliH